MSHEKFMTSSIVLFLDLIVVAFSGWVYWLVISKLIPISEVGQSTAVYSLIVLAVTIVGIGLEYPLLKKTSIDGPKIVGSSILIELIVTVAAIPFILAIVNNILHESSQSVGLISIVMLMSISLVYVARYSLLGISASRTVLIIDIITAALKFVTGYFLVVSGFGTIGVLLSFMLQALVTLCIALAVIKKRIGFSIGNLRYIKDTVKGAVVNVPSIFSRTLIVTLSVVLLASYGISSSEVGVFYISLMISVVAAGLISSTAYMVIPASSFTQTDLTTGSIRIGITFTAPIISLLLSSPKLVLSVIGTEYVSGYVVLMILAVGILPFAISTNMISRLNYLGMTRKLLMIGSLQVIGFIVGFILLVPEFNAMGAAFAILLSYSVSSIPALIWSEKILLRYLVYTIVAIIAGSGTSIMLGLLLPEGLINEVTSVATSIVVTLATVFALKNTSIAEVRKILGTVVKGAR
jgi:O-antigen/teichoic acid export membrane protein